MQQPRRTCLRTLSHEKRSREQQPQSPAAAATHGVWCSNRTATRSAVICRQPLLLLSPRYTLQHNACLIQLVSLSPCLSAAEHMHAQLHHPLHNMEQLETKRLVRILACLPVKAIARLAPVNKAFAATTCSVMSSRQWPPLQSCSRCHDERLISSNAYAYINFLLMPHVAACLSLSVSCLHYLDGTASPTAAAHEETDVLGCSLPASPSLAVATARESVFAVADREERRHDGRGARP